MAFEHKLGQGSLFPNNQKGENLPSMKGKIKAHRDIREGELLEIAGWTKTKDGTKWLSLKLSDPYRQEAKQEAPQPEPDDSFPPF
tara:strand:+ start:2157 stop:2411 length:255 start_codon:yes stop_codon:yes gene_type:complete